MPTRTKRGSPWRRPCAALLAAALGCAGLPAQEAPERAVPTPVDFETGQDDNLFSLRRSQDDIHDFELALGELRDGENRAAVERLQRLLQRDRGGVLPVARGRFVGMRLAVVLALANLTPGGQAAYRDLVARDAGELATRPLPSLTTEQLELLAQRFPAADLGRAARTRLGDLALEAGDGVAAAGHFRRALDAAALGSSEERRLFARLSATTVLVQPSAARARDRDHELPPDLGDVLAVLPEANDSPTYAGYNGGRDGTLPMAPLAGHPRTPWLEEVGAPGFRRRESALYAMFPVGDLDGIYVATGRELLAFDPLRTSLAWASPAPLRDAGVRDLRDYEDQINPDLVLAAACGGDTVVAALQVPENSVNVEFQGNYRILSKIPMRRLFAFTRSTGKPIWSHFDSLDGPRTRRFRGHDSCGPPLVLGDTVYAPVHDRAGAIAFAVAAYDLATGQTRWRRLVCSSQQDVNMFGNARLEFAASPLSVHAGVLYGSSNLGVAYALDLATGDVRWITAYDVVQMPLTAMHNQQDRVVYFANNAPVVADGVVCATPLDSQFALGLDAETGRELWRLPADAPVAGLANHVRWLAGTFGHEFVLTGYGAVAVKARPNAAIGSGKAEVRQLVAIDRLRDRGDARLAPRPAIAGDRIWFARVDQVVGFDRDGNPVPPGEQVPLPRCLPGNLLFVDGILVSLRQQAMAVALDAAALRERVEQRLAASPDDPAAILRLATLRAALLPSGEAGDQRAAVRDLYRRGLEACIRRGYTPQHPVRATLQRELFETALAAADGAQRSGDAGARAALVEARDTAPDQASWITVQMRLLDLERGAGASASYRTELERLAREAPTGSVPIGDGLPVRAYVAWQLATSPDLPPAEAVATWQRLLEDFPDLVLADRTAAAAGEAAIAELVRRHGADVYAPIAARAAQALAAAGNDPTALAAVSAHFPNSTAATTARLRLLDRSVADGDLAMACDVLLHDQRNGEPTPGILRRVAAAAVLRGNRPLAAAMLARLHAFAGAASDWPDDRGADYGAVIARLRGELGDAADGAAPAATLGVPERQVARIQPGSPRDAYVPVPVLGAPGFPRAADEPLFVQNDDQLCAIDVHAAAAVKPTLFTTPIRYAEQLVVCDRTLIVPDNSRVFAVDLRSGTPRWELTTPQPRNFENLGVQAGVLHVVGMAASAAATAELYGIEPLTGTVLFVRPLFGETPHVQPKAIAGELLLLGATDDGGLVFERIDPVNGRTRATIRLTGDTLRAQAPIDADLVGSRIFPQDLAADRDRIYLPLDDVGEDQSPRLLAIAGDGTVAWTWRGTAGAQLRMAACRGSQVVLAETRDRDAGRAVVLAADDGRELRSLPLGAQAQPLNWLRTTLDNPAPPILAFADAGVPVAPVRRVVCLPVDGDRPPFEVALGSEDGAIELQPQFGPDFVTFCARPLRHGACRLYAVRFDGRTGALADGARYVRLALPRSTSGMSAVGPYTVIAYADSLLLMGANQPK